MLHPAAPLAVIPEPREHHSGPPGASGPDPDVLMLRLPPAVPPDTGSGLLRITMMPVHGLIIERKFDYVWRTGEAVTACGPDVL